MGRGNKEKRRDKKNENSSEVKNEPNENKETEKEKEKERGENHETQDIVNNSSSDKIGTISTGNHETTNLGNNGMNPLEKKNETGMEIVSPERKDKKSSKEKKKNEKNRNRKGEDTYDPFNEHEGNDNKEFTIPKDFKIDAGTAQEEGTNYHSINVNAQSTSKNDGMSNTCYEGISEDVDSNKPKEEGKKEGITCTENNMESTKTKKNKKNTKQNEQNVNKEKINNMNSISKSDMNATHEKLKGNTELIKETDAKYSLDMKGEYTADMKKNKEGEQEQGLEENINKVEEKMCESTSKGAKKKESNKKKNTEKSTSRKKSNEKETNKMSKEEMKEEKDPKEDMNMTNSKKKKNEKETKEEMIGEIKDQITKEESKENNMSKKNKKEGVTAAETIVGEQKTTEPTVSDEFKWNADEDIPLEELIYETTERSKKYNRHKFGLLGILKIMRQTDPDLNMLSLGIDLTTLGLNLNHAESLYSSFASPFADDPTYKNDDFIKPKSYSNTLFQIRLSLLLKLKTETLFYIFYNLPRDALQAYAASELYIRKWVFHTVYKKWFTPVNHADFANLSKCKLWIYFEPHNSWTKKQHDDYLNVNEIMKVEEVTKCIEQIIKLQSSYNFSQNNNNNNSGNSSGNGSTAHIITNQMSPKGNNENKNNTVEDMNHNTVGMNHEPMQ